jgi:predicted nucleic acid-binding protein
MNPRSRQHKTQVIDNSYAVIYAIIMALVVIDTNVFVAALRTTDAISSSARALLRAVLAGRYKPLFSNALWLEYEDLLGRRDVWNTDTTASERENILKALAACGQWVTIYYGWRPNLPGPS